MYLLSTRAFRDLVLRDRGKPIAAWLEATQPEDLFVSVISIAAVAAAIETLADDRMPMRRLLAEAKRTFVEQGAVLPVSLEAAEEWARLSVMSLQIQEGDERVDLGEDDRLVIATAIAHDLTYVTGHETFLETIARDTTLKLVDIDG